MLRSIRVVVGFVQCGFSMTDHGTEMELSGGDAEERFE